MASNTSEDGHLPVFGLEIDEATGQTTDSTLFYVIHGLALVSLGVSIIVSIGVIIYLSKSSNEKNIFKRQIGERLVVYLSVVDLCYSVSHSMDHIYMIAVLDHPPDGACMYFAFFLQYFIMAQALVVMFTAFNAFYMVVRERKINLGRYDWKLLTGALSLPAIIGIIGVSVPFLGPSGPWCFVDMRKPWGAAMNNFYGMAMVTVFLWNGIFYGMVWVKITHATRSMATKTESQKKYHRLAKVMLMFVVVYIVQWFIYIVQALWSLHSLPNPWVYVPAVVFCNTGGVFNFIAYTIIRKKYQNPGRGGDVAQNQVAPLNGTKGTGNTTTPSTMETSTSD